MRFYAIGIGILAAMACGICGSPLWADWPQWRGMRRDGIIDGFTAPANWPAELKSEWSTEIGEGHASPAWVGERVYTLTRFENDEVLRCLTLDGGIEKWRVQYAVDPKLDGAVGRFGSSPRATPTVHDSRVFTLGASGVLTCVQAESGKQLWQHAFADRFEKPYPEFGAAASPLVVDGLCVVPIGGKKKGALAAFDVMTGAQRWAVGSDGPSYASPVVLALAGKPQIVTQTQAAVIGVSLAGKMLWSIPFTTDYDQNINTAVAFGDIVVYSGTRQPLSAVRIARAGQPTAVWNNPAHPLYMSSAVLKEELLFGMSEKSQGHIFCVDVRTGDTLWKSAGRAGENVSIQRAGDVLVLLNDQGKLTFAKAGGQAYEVLQAYQVSDDSTFAHPVIAGGRVLIKDRLRLISYRFE